MLFLKCVCTGIVATVLISLSASISATDPDNLHDVLKSDSSIREKQNACKQLAVVGTVRSVPILAAMLSDKKLAHAARFALESIPDASVDVALRDSLNSLSGNLLVGVINSIGVRRDSQAGGKLTDLLGHSNASISAAAAAALGQIANPAAVATLLKRLNAAGTDIGEVAMASLAAGDVLANDQQQVRAIEVYDAVRQSKAPRSLLIAATWSAVRARSNSSLPLITELLQGDDDAMFAIALQAARGPIRNRVQGLLVNELSQENPDRRALLITTLGDLADTAVLPEITPWINATSQVVQLAVIRALKEIGNSSVVDSLIELAAEGSDGVAHAALQSLEGMRGDDVDAKLASMLAADDSDELLISLAGSRRIAAAIPDLWSAAESSNTGVRHAALRALGETIGQSEIRKLIRIVLAVKNAEGRDVAVAALTKACMRAPDREAAVRQVSSDFSRAPVEMRFVLYELLRVVGGKTALKQVVAGARDPRDASQDAATQALGKWLTPDVSPELLRLAKSFRSRKYRVRSMRAYVRVIQQFGLPAERRLEMARQAFKTAERNEEKILALNTLVRFTNLKSLALATDQLSDPALRDTAADIALKMATPNYGMTEIIRDEAALRSAMQKIIQSGASPNLVERARKVLAAVEG